MIFEPNHILSLLKNTYPSITFLHNQQATSLRFKNKSIIIFSFKSNHKEHILKFYSLQHLDIQSRLNEINDIHREFRIAKGFEIHPHFIKVFDLFELRHKSEILGLCMVMERFPMTLHEYMTTRFSQGNTFTPSEVAGFMNQMGNALEFAHYRRKEPIVHADIKPPNIGLRFYGRNIQYALMDFDISVRIYRTSAKPDQNFTLSNLGKLKGLTPEYAAPEQIVASMNNQGVISNRIDIYAIGAIGIQMFTGVAPKRGIDELFFKLPVDRLRSHEWKALFERICNPDPRKRPRIISGLTSSGKLKILYPSMRLLLHNKTRPVLLPVLLIVLGFLLLTTISTGIFLIIYNAYNPGETTPIQNNNNSTILKDKSEPKPTYVIMPEVYGMTLNGARERLEGSGLQLGQVRYFEYYREYSGLVLATSYKPGEIISIGTSVDMYLGK